MKKIKPEYRPRLSVEITEDQQLALRKYLDFGMQKRLFSIIVDDVIGMLERHGRLFLAAVMLKEVSYGDYTSLGLGKKGEKDGNDK